MPQRGGGGGFGERERGNPETEMETETETRHVTTQRNEARASSGPAHVPVPVPALANSLHGCSSAKCHLCPNGGSAQRDDSNAFARACGSYLQAIPETEAGRADAQCPHWLPASLSLGNKMNYMLLQAAASLADDCSGHLRPSGACR